MGDALSVPFIVSWVNIILSKEKTWKKKLADFLSGPVMCKFTFEYNEA